MLLKSMLLRRLGATRECTLCVSPQPLLEVPRRISTRPLNGLSPLLRMVLARASYVGGVRQLNLLVKCGAHRVHMAQLVWP